LLTVGLCLSSAAWAANDAVFVSQNVPASVPRSANFAVEITFQNTGDTTWTRDTGYILGSENPRDNFTWSTNRIWLDPVDSVAPGAIHTFRATLTAPAQEGSYEFQWQVLQDAVEWFGLPSVNLTIEVSAPQLVCDGSEVLCLDLTSPGQVTATGGTVVGGDFAADGFMPTNQGGIDWIFGPERNFSAGELEVTVTGLQPLPGGEQEGGKVSLFNLCGLAPQDNETIDLQKMAEDYRDGHIFRYGMDDDGLADNWDAVIITGAGFGCYYSINDPPWQAGQSHQVRATWDRDGLALWIDGHHCSSGGNGDTFDPASKVFTLANRCTHYANQQAIARFSNLRLWARGVDLCGNGQLDPGETCDGDCPAGCDDGDACTADGLTGNAANCNVVCQHAPIGTCSPGDGCCPAGCDYTADSDCSAPDCGNGQLDPGETCDGDCPATCEDADPCTSDALLGSALNCDAHCTYAPVLQCASGDGCCPAGCEPADDTDCPPETCGNGQLDPGETCDGDCPISCDDADACTSDTLTGVIAACNVACSYQPIAACAWGDGCCPPGCTPQSDVDCADESSGSGGCQCAARPDRSSGWVVVLIWIGLLYPARRWRNPAR
jgi:hypothetical protein